jgi:hypothetical protein
MGINLLLDILKYTVSGWLVVLGAYLLYKNHRPVAGNSASTHQSISSSKDFIALKLQAFERLILFIERIHPANIFVRLHLPGMSAIEMQSLILNEIRAEYQHNITQQLYVSTDTWTLIKRVKEDTITIINGAVNQLDNSASAVDLSKLVFGQLSTLDESPYDLALRIIKTEMEEL